MWHIRVKAYTKKKFISQEKGVRIGSKRAVLTVESRLIGRERY
jgi:hypothetical protein